MPIRPPAAIWKRFSISSYRKMPITSHTVAKGATARHGGGGPGAPKVGDSHKSHPPAAAIFHSAKVIAPFGSSRRRTRFYFRDRQMRGCRLRRDAQRKFLRDRKFFAPSLV